MRRAMLLVLLLAIVAIVAAAAPASPAPAVVDGAWVAGRVSAGGVVLLDARPLREFLAAHLPGARSLPVETLRSSAFGVPAQLHAPAVLEEILVRLGLVPGDHLVVYGAETDPDATFVAATLRSAGIRAVSLLDGGFARWSAEGRPTTAERSRVEPGKVHVSRPLADLADLAAVRRAVEKKDAVLVDARPVEQYEAGRIPGAIGRPWKQDLVADGERAGLLKDPATLRAEYAALGILPEHPVIVYCNSGHMASEVFYALRHVVGYPRVAIYDGSMLEWGMDPSLPKETGPAAAIPQEALERARRAADALTTALLARLTAEWSAGGPVRALEVCSQVAPELAREHSGEVTRVRRVSMKARNPQDAPDSYERQKLVAFEALQRAGSLPRESAELVSEGGRRELRYLRPILVTDRCLACHGPVDGLATEVREILVRRYPEDVAVGYARGDLRGAVSVRTLLD